MVMKIMKNSTINNEPATMDDKNKVSTLIVMVGLSGSGKSTSANEFVKYSPQFGEMVIVSSDAIREELTGTVNDQSRNNEVFQIFHKRIREYLLEGKNVIADAANLTMKSRRAILNNVSDLTIKKACYIIPKPFHLCMAHNDQRAHRVPNNVLELQVKRFQIPFYEEGWDKITVLGYNAWETNKISNLELLASTYQFDQKNPHHNLTLDKHCMLTYKIFSRKRPSNCLFAGEYLDPFLMGAKLHDIGKISCQTIDDNGIAHYYGHSEIGSYIILSQMMLPKMWTNTDLLDCCFLVNYHMLPFTWNTEKTCERWKKRFGEEKYKMLIDFHDCDTFCKKEN